MCFFAKIQLAARGHNKFVTFEEFNIYSLVIPHFHLIYPLRTHFLSSFFYFQDLVSFHVFFLKKCKMAA